MSLIICSTSVFCDLRERDEWWLKRNAAINERVKLGGIDLLFIGDSITHNFENVGKKYWDQYYAHRRAINMGFWRDRTEDVLWRLKNGHLEGITPKLVVLMIGTNNSYYNTALEMADGIRDICLFIRQKSPETKILILAIFPKGPAPSPIRVKDAKASKLASKLADDQMIYYMNINRNFLKEDGTLPKEIWPDYLHPNQRGYQIWVHSIELMVANLMK